MDTQKTPAAVVVGHVNLKKVVPAEQPKAAVKQVRRDFKRQDNRPQNMSMQAQELQYLKAQIKSLRENLNGYDDLRAQVARLAAAVKMQTGAAGRTEAIANETVTLVTIFNTL